MLSFCASLYDGLLRPLILSLTEPGFCMDKTSMSVGLETIAHRMPRVGWVQVGIFLIQTTKTTLDRRKQPKNAVKQLCCLMLLLQPSWSLRTENHGTLLSFPVSLAYFCVVGVFRTMVLQDHSVFNMDGGRNRRLSWPTSRASAPQVR